MHSPLERYLNKGWSAKKLEAMVWDELVCYLSNHGLIANELEKQRQDAGHHGAFEVGLQ